MLLPKWNALSEEEQASYNAMEQADRERYELEKDLENAVCVNIERTFLPKLTNLVQETISG